MKRKRDPPSRQSPPVGEDDDEENVDPADVYPFAEDIHCVLLTASRHNNNTLFIHCTPLESLEAKSCYSRLPHLQLPRFYGKHYTAREGQ